MMFCSAILMPGEPESVISAICIFLYCVWMIYQQSKRLFSRFQYDESDTTNFDDLLDLPMMMPRQAAARVVGGIRGGLRDAASLIRNRGDEDQELSEVLLH
jgi:hypothetical protein